MKSAVVCFVFSLLFLGMASAHFGMLIPDRDIVQIGENPSIGLKIMFAHPFEGVGMEMEKPAEVGYLLEGKRVSILSKLRRADQKLFGDTESHQAWRVDQRLTRPGDYIFFVEPKPYWEPAEDKFIIHYTKVVVSAFGKEEGWDEEVGLRTEIIPLTRPYGIYAGNVFQGIVKVNGKPAPFSEVEVEYFNEDGSVHAPKSAFVTQLTRCDANGVFTYAIPRAGWWGFAALNEADETIPKDGDQKSVEIGAVIWIKAYDMR